MILIIGEVVLSSLKLYRRFSCIAFAAFARLLGSRFIAFAMSIHLLGLYIIAFATVVHPFRFYIIAFAMGKNLCRLIASANAMA